ncbi:hypothetical protein MRO80_21910, partial [Dickeya dianthicola]|uniref:hypothetical protein n=1 Tax=Dickeya dianthicola TaxID=204039 RepID=UPI001F6037CA
SYSPQQLHPLRSQPTNTIFPCAVSQLQPLFPEAFRYPDTDAPIRGFGPRHATALPGRLPATLAS